jgi:hypothetical protein
VKVHWKLAAPDADEFAVATKLFGLAAPDVRLAMLVYVGVPKVIDGAARICSLRAWV